MRRAARARHVHAARRDPPPRYNTRSKASHRRARLAGRAARKERSSVWALALSSAGSLLQVIPAAVRRQQVQAVQRPLKYRREAGQAIRHDASQKIAVARYRGLADTGETAGTAFVATARALIPARPRFRPPPASGGQAGRAGCAAGRQRPLSRPDAAARPLPLQPYSLGSGTVPLGDGSH